MEVTTENFKEVLEELNEVIENASFFAVDCEFTGLTSGGPDVNQFDRPDTYYSKLRNSSMNFLVIQVGLSVFTYLKDKNSWSTRSYNFYVFPRPIANVFDARFMCQASSIEFLIQQGFDFNKVFKFGIPYLTKSDEEKFIKKQERDRDIRLNGLDDIQISDLDKPHVEEYCKLIEDYIRSKEQSLILEDLNGYMRRIIHQEVRKRWRDLVRVEHVVDNGIHHLVVKKKGSREDEERYEAEVKAQEQIKLQNAIGFTNVLRKIADSQKLIVGHNMLLDICLIINQFFDNLPTSYREFKALVHGLFPRLLDTKILCQLEKIREIIPNSRLQDVLKTVKAKPFTMPEIEDVEGRSYSLSNPKLHEAGYDAYMTGVCFLALINYLGLLQQPQVTTVLHDSPIINSQLNKLLMTRLRDVPVIDLLKDDPKPNRDHVFHITFPASWTGANITRLFEPWGTVIIAWLNDTSAYISMKQAQVKDFNKNRPTTNGVIITKYWDYQETIEKDRENVKQERKRKISEAEKPEPVKQEITVNLKNQEVKKQEQDGVWEVAAGKRRRKRNRNTQDNERNPKSQKTFHENDAWT